jgi:hypothetical protein
MENNERRKTNQSEYFRANGDPIGYDEPLRIGDAVTIVFKGALGVSALKAEADKKRLTIEKIANKDFVTIRYIDEMRKQCRGKSSHQNLSSKTSELEIDIGISDTNTGSMQQDAARTTLQALKQNSKSS